VLDLAGTALADARARLGALAAAVQWLQADVTAAALPPGHFALWHDRAVFHFLVDPAARQAYVEQAWRSLRRGGHLIVATFAEDGPTQCSGLPVMRYSADALHAAFRERFTLIASEREDHRTPAGKRQAFTYCVMRRD
jgi:SAM-dependent methyltransferase